MEVLIGKSPINGELSIAMFDYRRVVATLSHWFISNMFHLSFACSSNQLLVCGFDHVSVSAIGPDYRAKPNNKPEMDRNGSYKTSKIQGLFLAKCHTMWHDDPL